MTMEIQSYHRKMITLAKVTKLVTPKRAKQLNFDVIFQLRRGAVQPVGAVGAIIRVT